MISREEGFFDEEKRVFIESLINAFSPFVSNLRLIELNRELSLRDPLTNLYNRRFIVEFFEKRVNESIRNDEKMGILLIDADNFKKLNDTYGHETGDLALKQISHILKSSVREMDVIERWGGEEFIVLLPAISTNTDAIYVANRIRENISNSFLSTADGRQVSLTVSIGVAISPDDGKDIDQLLRVADEKLYRAKKYKNTVVF